MSSLELNRRFLSPSKDLLLAPAKNLFLLRIRVVIVPDLEHLRTGRPHCIRVVIAQMRTQHRRTGRPHCIRVVIAQIRIQHRRAGRLRCIRVVIAQIEHNIVELGAPTAVDEIEACASGNADDETPAYARSSRRALARI